MLSQIKPWLTGALALTGQSACGARKVGAQQDPLTPGLTPMPPPDKAPAPAPGLAPTPAPAPALAPGPAMPPQFNGTLRVNGTTLQNDNGERVRLRGVNISGMDWGYGDPQPDEIPAPCWPGQTIMDTVNFALDTIDINFIRLPITPRLWSGNDTTLSADYRSTVDNIVNTVTRRGAYIDIDMHGSMMNAGLLTYSMPDLLSVDVMVDIALRYKDNGQVLLGIWNEPFEVEWDIWRDGGIVNQTGVLYLTPGHQGIVNTLRNEGVENIIVVGGLDWGYNLTGLTQGYALDDDNILYDSHVYPWKQHNTSWDANVGIAAADYPIIIGEFGASATALGPFTTPAQALGPFATTEDFLSELHAWIEKYDFPYAPWSMNVAGPPVMLADWCYTLTPDFGAIVVNWLNATSVESLATGS